MVSPTGQNVAMDSTAAPSELRTFIRDRGGTSSLLKLDIISTDQSEGACMWNGIWTQRQESETSLSPYGYCAVLPLELNRDNKLLLRTNRVLWGEKRGRASLRSCYAPPAIPGLLVSSSRNKEQWSPFHATSFKWHRSVSRAGRQHIHQSAAVSYQKCIYSQVRPAEPAGSLSAVLSGSISPH